LAKEKYSGNDPMTDLKYAKLNEKAKRDEILNAYRQYSTGLDV